VIATVFVCRFSYHQSTTAAVSRVAATSVSFALCLIYLIFLPFSAWALAVLIGASAGGHADRPARRRNYRRDHHGGRHGRGCREPARCLAAAHPPLR